MKKEQMLVPLRVLALTNTDSREGTEVVDEWQGMVNRVRCSDNVDDALC
jgi:hypothetical protein